MGAAAFLVLISASVLAAELPTVKAGLWESKMSFDKRDGAGLAIQQCVDASTNQMIQSSFDAIFDAASEMACPKPDVQRSGDTITMAMTCTRAGKTTTARSVITGSFDSAYTMTVTSESAGLSGDKFNMTVVAKWLGPCAADQKPGDMIMPGGFKMNILEQMPKSGLLQGGPPQQ